MPNYIWTQKAVDDYAIRHPHVSLAKNPRKVGEIATYEGEPLVTGEIQRAFMARGLIEVQKKPKRARARKVIPLKEVIAEDLRRSEELPKKRDLVIWRELVEYSKEGYSITDTSLRCGMPISKIEAFIKANKERFEKQYGSIAFAKKRKRVEYVPGQLRKVG